MVTRALRCFRPTPGGRPEGRLGPRPHSQSNVTLGLLCAPHAFLPISFIICHTPESKRGSRLVAVLGVGCGFRLLAIPQGGRDRVERLSKCVHPYKAREPSRALALFSGSVPASAGYAHFLCLPGQMLSATLCDAPSVSTGTPGTPSSRAGHAPAVTLVPSSLRCTY